MFRLIIKIKYFIFIKRSIIIKIYLYVLPLQRHLSKLIMWLIEILVHRRIGGFSGFRKLSGVKYRVFMRK